MFTKEPAVIVHLKGENVALYLYHITLRGYNMIDRPYIIMNTQLHGLIGIHESSVRGIPQNITLHTPKTRLAKKRSNSI